ncbi:unnamed protein product [Effrenium voratum]|nr:unnamed protein product [Effrenium voratum]|mmetsp:Transcript_8898/g.21112  ORF Transcript_8898/g.21112 Transcript_8898/m.21112 type:complete len:445 (+) Transcript_8898:102-1436(+)
MGVTHSMEEPQVKRISKALNASATAIQGINSKFDEIDGHVQKMMEFNQTTNKKVSNVLNSFERLDDTFNDRAEMLLEAMVGATNSATDILEAAVLCLEKVNIRQEIDNIPKALIPLAMPFIILLIELAVSNAYLGILLASLPSVSVRYSNYLLAYASSTLMGLFLSLLWLVCYRLWLSMHSKTSATTEQTVELLRNLRTRSSVDSFGDLSVSSTEDKVGLSPSDSGSEFQRSRNPAESISRARSRRMERKMQRQSESQKEDGSLVDCGLDPSFSSGSSPNLSPELAPASMDPNLPPLDPVEERLSNALSEFADEAQERATPDAKVAGEDGGNRKLPRTLSGSSRLSRSSSPFSRGVTPPVARVPSIRSARSGRNGLSAQEQNPDNSALGEGAGRKKGMLQMRWRKWENPFALDVTWGQRGRSSTSDAPPPEPGGDEDRMMAVSF